MTEDLLLELAKKYGTPAYVYDGNQIIENYKNFQAAFDVPKLKIHFAAKALTNMAILRLFNELGAGLDCVSMEEVQIGLDVGFKAEDIIFTPNGVGMDEYTAAIDVGCKITVDNLSILEKIGAAYADAPIPIFLRLNPHLMAGGNNKISGSKFGISIHQIPLATRLINKYNMLVEGIHIHTGSDIIDPDIFERVATLIFSIADSFDDIQSIDFGSGFKVRYKSFW